MDVTLVRTLLQQRRKLASVQLQNHIYGCYLIMEDIATKTLVYQNGILKGSTFTIDLASEFNNIGLRYGFVMDTKLALGEDVPPEYRANWLAWFIHLSEHATPLTEVDRMEDEINVIIREAVHADDAFFMKAVETGTLPQEWMGKLIRWLQHGEQDPVAEEEPTITKISQAKTEKTTRRRVLSTTIRHRPIRSQARLATTRRAKLIKQ